MLGIQTWKRPEALKKITPSEETDAINVMIIDRMLFSQLQHLIRSLDICDRKGFTERMT